MSGHRLPFEFSGSDCARLHPIAHMLLAAAMLLGVQAASAPSLAQRPSASSPQLLAVGEAAAAAELLGIDQNWQISFLQAGQRKELAVGRVVAWGAESNATRGPQALLTDGSRVVTRGLNLAGERLVLQSELWGEPQGTDVWGSVSVPLSKVRGILFRPPLDDLERDRLTARILATEGERDRLLLDNGDQLSGILTAIGDAEVRLDTPAGPAIVSRDKVVAVLLDPALRPTPRTTGTHALIGFRTGSLLHVAAAETTAKTGPAAETKVGLTLVCGLKLSSNPDERNVWNSAVSLQCFGGDAVYLSDLRPLGYKHVPLLSLPWSYGTDRNVLGGRLRTATQSWSKGLGMHSTSRLAWALPEGYRRFAAELALDAAAGDAGSVRYRVYRDNADGDFQLVYESDIIRGGQATLPISVDIASARRLVLIADYADHGDQRDYANWLNARLEK